MAHSFAAASARMDASVLRCLGNAQARLMVGGDPFTVIYSAQFVSPLGIGAAQPAATAAASAVASAPADARIVIDVNAGRGEVPAVDAPVFTIRSTEDADGMVRLMLERVL